MPTEASRERDLRRYYQPWLDARSLVGATLTGENEGNALTYKGFQPVASRDKALTAFAQLATLRLNVRRAMVSLIDSKQQYILAEATKTLSLADDTPEYEDDQMWLGNAILDREVAVCPHTFGSEYTASHPNGHTLSTEALVVPDMRLDARFADLSYVKAKPGVLFYAGVPIRTAAGHNIGVYAVSSDEPRFGLTLKELRFMKDVAGTVMQHLEMAKAVDDRYKGEKMVRGLAYFIEGADTTELHTPAEENQLVAKEGVTASADAGPKPALSASSATLARQTSNARIEDAEEEESVKVRRPRDGSVLRSPDKSPDGPPLQKQEQKQEKDDISQTFYRAARIIRDATAADGVVFFGTGTSVPDRDPSDSSNGNPSDVSDTSDSGFSSGNQAPRKNRKEARGSFESTGADVDPPDPTQSPKLCEVVGWAVDKSNADIALQKHHLNFPENSMERYIRRYPHGKYFSFSDSGSGISSDEKSESEMRALKSALRMQEAHQRSKKKAKRPALIPTEVLKFLPGLRNLIFLPLWDAAAEKWSAGAFIWSSNPARLMSPIHELPFLKAFGNSIMSEVARLNAQKADRAKSTFIASVSHELRSPLHGILGSVEFLQDTEMSTYQQGLLNSVEACGKTLLDTIDHVLDYAKINKLRGAGMRRKQQMATVISNSVLGADAEFDLSELVEEVVEAVAAGHSFRKSHSNAFFEGNTRMSTGLTPLDPIGSTVSQQHNDTVDIILDIFPHTGWTVRAQPGAIRRVVMNLLGNALKYTPSGYVSVSLKPSPPKGSMESDKDETLNITLRFEDSGKGMSLEYQRTRLFAPFSQEDPFMAGTGLGLSIVRQIVESLKGTISIKSVKDVGTEVEVTLSLPVVADKRSDTSQIVGPVARETKDLKVGLMLSSANDRRVAASVRQTCEQWFGMSMIEIPNLDDPSKHLLVLIECTTPVDRLLENYIFCQCITPVVVITHDTAREVGLKSKINQLSSSANSMIEVVSQPCGPFKLCEVYRKVKTYLENAKLKPSLHRASTSPSPQNLLQAMPGVPMRSASDYPYSIESRAPGGSSPLVGNPASATQTPRPSTPAAGDASEALAPPKVPDGSDYARPHILLVDDNPINLHLLVMFMKKCAYPYTTATNGLEALQAYQSLSALVTSELSDNTADQPQDPEASPQPTVERNSAQASQHQDYRKPITHILMDISMPVMDGLESTRQIRKFEQSRGLKPAKIIALTGLASQEAQEEASSSGVDAYLAKPVKFKELRKVLEENPES